MAEDDAQGESNSLKRKMDTAELEHEFARGVAGLNAEECSGVVDGDEFSAVADAFLQPDSDSEIEGVPLGQKLPCRS